MCVCVFILPVVWFCEYTTNYSSTLVLIDTQMVFRFSTMNTILCVFHCLCLRILLGKIPNGAIPRVIFDCALYESMFLLKTSCTSLVPTLYIWPKFIFLCRTSGGCLFTNYAPFLHQQYPNFPLVSSFLSHFWKFRWLCHKASSRNETDREEPFSTSHPLDLP